MAPKTTRAATARVAKPAKPTPKTSATGLVNVNLRIPTDLLAAIDARVEQANAAGGWPRVTRTDWMRDVISKAVKP